MKYRVPVEFEADSHEEARHVVAMLAAVVAGGGGDERVLTDELTYETSYFYHVPAAVVADASEVA